MKYLEKIQGLLPLGYLYLILLGLLKEGILYHQLGINIIEYSSITDILLSPIAEMTSGPTLIVVTIAIVIIFFIIQTILVQNSHKSWAKKFLGENRFSNVSTKKEVQKTIFPIFALLMALELLAVFIGMGIGQGSRVVNKIQNNELDYGYKVTYATGRSEDIYVIDRNSSYYFYLTKGNKNIKIAPVASINSLELLKNNKVNGK